MTESDARAVLLVRAFEADEKAGTPWSAADAAAAENAARREVGESATSEDWIVARARVAAARITQRDPAAAAALRGAGWPGWLAAALIALALAVGVAGDALGGAHRINLLAPPLLALLVWNVVVYVVLIVHGLRRPPRDMANGPIRSTLVNWLTRAGARVGIAEGPSTAPLAAFFRTWTSAARPLYGARVALVLHASAAALVLGALLSLYARGLVLEYRAGWDSTFLSPADVRAVLATVLAPASSLSGIALPDTARVAAMRFSAGPGENAAPWIHLYAITLALVVFAPRLVLAIAAAARASRLVSRFPLPLDDAYFRRLQRDGSGLPIAVQVLPYSYQVSPSQRETLRRVLEDQVAARIDLVVADTLPLGAEDDLARWIGSAPGTPASPASSPMLVAVFPLTTTPEHEQHGALVRALVAHAGKEHVTVLVDESGFRRRFSGETLATRLRERQQAWRSLLQETGVEPLFADLGESAASTTATASLSRPAHS